MIRTVLATNPGPMTLSGTNTYLICHRGRVLVVDPGPDDADHLAATLSAAAGDTVVHVVVTHSHADHTEGVSPLVTATGALTLDPSAPDGRRALAWYGVEVVPVPGHTPDSVCFVRDGIDGPVLLTGDTVLGAGPSVVDDLGDYLRSLDLIAALVAERGTVRLLPGHGPVVTSPAAHVAALIRHRTERLEEVRRAVAEGADTPRRVVELVYPGLDDALVPAALASAEAQLAYLRTTGPAPARH